MGLLYTWDYLFTHACILHFFGHFFVRLCNIGTHGYRCLSGRMCVVKNSCHAEWNVPKVLSDYDAFHPSRIPYSIVYFNITSIILVPYISQCQCKRAMQRKISILMFWCCWIRLFFALYAIIYNYCLVVK